MNTVKRNVDSRQGECGTTGIQEIDCLFTSYVPSSTVAISSNNIPNDRSVLRTLTKLVSKKYAVRREGC